jgi:uncharacterized membrane-anchored protein YitT (DUF2179 family)
VIRLAYHIAYSYVNIILVGNFKIRLDIEGGRKLKKLIKSINKKELAVDILFEIVGGAIYAAGVYLFAKSAEFAPGGVTGLAILINHYLKDIPIGIITLVLNVPIAIFSYKVLGRRFFAKSIKTMIIVAALLDFVFPHIAQYKGDPLMAALFGGALLGVGLALVYMRGSSTGGTDFVILSIRKKHSHISIGQITLGIDGVIIALGGIVFGRIDAVLQGLIMTVTSTVVIDKIMYGVSSGKSLMIITEKGAEISKEIVHEIGRGATIMAGKGAYSGLDKQVLVCACSKSQTYKIREVVRKIDDKALIIINSFDEAFGFGFKGLDE